MVLPRFILLPSPQACIQLSLASAQLLHRWVPQHHTLGSTFSIPWHCSSRAAGAKAGMKGPIVYHAYKGSVLRFLWGQGNAERQLPTQQDRVKLCSFDSPRMGIHLFRTAEAASKPCRVRIPEESSVPTEPVERQPLKVILAKPSSAIARGLPVVKGSLSVLAWLSLGRSLFASEAPEDWGTRKQESGVYSVAYSPQMWDVWQHWIFITRELMGSCKGSLKSSNNLWLNTSFKLAGESHFSGFKPVCSPQGPGRQGGDKGSAELSYDCALLFLRLKMGSERVQRRLWLQLFLVLPAPSLQFPQEAWASHFSACGALCWQLPSFCSWEQDASVICSGLSPWLHVPQEATQRGSDPQPVSRPSHSLTPSPAYLRVSYPIDSLMIETNPSLTCFLSR